HGPHPRAGQPRLQPPLPRRLLARGGCGNRRSPPAGTRRRDRPRETGRGLAAPTRRRAIGGRGLPGGRPLPPLRGARQGAELLGLVPPQGRALGGDDRLRAGRATEMIVLPNLGAEEGLEPSALPPALDDAVRVFAWLFGKDVRILDWEGEIAWPEALGPAPGGPLLSELEGDAFAWLATAEAQERLRAAGGHPRLPPPSVVRAVHDKAFAQRAALQSGRLPDYLRGLIEVLEPDEIDPAVVEAKVRSLPPWVGRDWMLKPRWGSSGRGRVRRLQDVRGSTDRLRRLGGAVFEPWLRRVEDLSALLLLLP